MVSRSLSFGIAVAAIMLAVLVSGCVQQPGGGPGTTPTISPPNTIPGTTPVASPPTVPPTTPEAEIFDVNVNPLNCTWTVKIGDYNVRSDCVRISSRGTARGPVGARLELPLLSWSDDRFNCGAWTLKSGALVAVGSTCVRGQASRKPRPGPWIREAMIVPSRIISTTRDPTG